MIHWLAPLNGECTGEYHRYHDDDGQPRRSALDCGYAGAKKTGSLRADFARMVDSHQAGDMAPFLEYLSTLSFLKFDSFESIVVICFVLVKNFQ